MARGDPKGGRPPYKPTQKDEAFVRALVIQGVPQAEITRVIGVNEKTLRKHFREILDTAMVQANANVVANLYKQATKDDPRSITAAIYWTKVRLRWREPKAELEHSGAVGTYDLSKLNDAQLDALQSILAGAALAGADQGREGETGG